ncbi:glycosyltransferase family 2 protein [Commensalibacter nepenthis]|uniref:Glycosyltransferase family 2 protein n=1 Tax=Commensalibacter nepenthis TaxID=3043872 RepID=A0ABT6Q9K8_9PROT|nr:glycosyltransferase family 2 protein [Commensalibacter sp. TBRC 10068]MDI2113476.1 glycosyltransferase family 2 protein [Commensalibacter sp. TBRC 10068]
MKVGAVLFVKNEVEDIAWWISWHLSIGIDTIIIYDDYSSDGTWEVINAASKVFDVRPQRAASASHFNLRQAKTYKNAIVDYRDEFDWLICIDADEYIDIINGDDVHNFLNKYDDDIDGIALNWKCFGSNKHIIKPASPNVFENYHMRSNNDFEMNQYVKSFFKPKKASLDFINPHRFIVPGRYITPNGETPEWQEQYPEKTVALPDWTAAVIRHYVIRSAEHFVEKSKRRSDLRAANMGMGLFNFYDKNDEYEPMQLKRINAMYSYIYEIQHQTSLDIIAQIEMNSKMSKEIVSESSDIIDKIVVINAVTYFSTELVIDKDYGQLAHIHPDQKNQDVLPVTLFSIPSKPDFVFLIVLDNFSPMHQIGEARVSKILTYKKIELSENNFALQSPLTKRVITSAPVEGNNVLSYLECNRDEVREWETFTVKEVTEQKEGILVEIAKAITDHNLLNKDKINIDMNLYADAFFAGLVTFDDFELNFFKNKNNITNYPWFKQIDKLSI